MYVPDGMDLNSTGMTAGMGIGSNLRQSLLDIHFQAAHSSSTSEAVVKDMRWNSTINTQILRAILMREFSGSLPTSTADVKRIVSFIKSNYFTASIVSRTEFGWLFRCRGGTRKKSVSNS